MNLLDVKYAFCQGTGFIKNHDLRPGQCLQIIATLDQDPLGGSAADSAEKAQRNGENKSAGAGNHKKGKSPVQPS